MVYLLAFHKSNTAIGKQTIFKLIRYLNNKQISHYYTAMHIVCSFYRTVFKGKPETMCFPPGISNLLK